MNNVLFHLAASRESWGKGKQRGRQDSLHSGIGVKPALPFSYKVQQKPALSSADSCPFPAEELLGASEKSSG